jgi:hypothetical protein
VTNWRLWCATRMAHRQGEEPSSHNVIMPDKEGRDKPQTTHVAVYLSTSKQRAPNKLQNPTPSPKRVIKELWCLFFALISGFYIVLFGPNPILRVERALSFWPLLVL